MYFLRAIASAAALVGGLALLLADDAGPQCNLASFDRTFKLASSCGPVTETIRVTVAADAGVGNSTVADFEHLDGTEQVSSAGVSGTCKDGETIAYTSLTVGLLLAEPGQSATDHTCSIALDTLTANCYSSVAGGNNTCTLTVTEL